MPALLVQEFNLHDIGAPETSPGNRTPFSTLLAIRANRRKKLDHLVGIMICPIIFFNYSVDNLLLMLFIQEWKQGLPEKVFGFSLRDWFRPTLNENEASLLGEAIELKTYSYCCRKSSWYAWFFHHFRHRMEISPDGETDTTCLRHAPQTLPFASEVNLVHAERGVFQMSG